MNDLLQEFARSALKKGLSLCTEEEQMVFKRMYSNNDLNKDINNVVDSMHESKLDWAMQQVETTNKKNNRI